ncbi:putative glutathione S-transferase GSTU6 [Zea mays]|uniref:glutathione transferase n=1 Tax=Zea mays TaxID=4577 RepID=A0A317Y7N4_MAIZE|nr:putative glutathione S-transferase GSTU6 [Zea mays]
MAGGGDDELKLLGAWASPFVLRVKLALSFKGLSYEDVEEDLSGGKSELLLESNPVHKKVPVLLHNGKPVCESQIIVQYIDEAFAGTGGPSLLPADPHQRAVARFWGAYIDDKVVLLMLLMTLSFIFYLHYSTYDLRRHEYDRCPMHIDGVDASFPLQLLAFWLQSARAKTLEEKAEALKQALAAAENLEAAFTEISEGKPFFGGDSVGYLDVTLGAVVAWVHAAEKLYGMRLFDATRTPRLSAFVERFGALGAAKAVLPDVDVLVEYAKQRQADAAAAASDS